MFDNNQREHSRLLIEAKHKKALGDIAGSKEKYCELARKQFEYSNINAKLSKIYLLASANSAINGEDYEFAEKILKIIEEKHSEELNVPQRMEIERIEGIIQSCR